EGTVSDQNGRRIKGSVKAFRLTLKYGDLLPVAGPSQRIDGTGYFRLTELQPGRYYIAFVADPPSQFSENIAYRPAIYPGVGHIKEARILELKAGGQERVDFRVASEPAYSVKGSVEGGN